jgi:hypothetical protein
MQGGGAVAPADENKERMLKRRRTIGEGEDGGARTARTELEEALRGELAKIHAEAGIQADKVDGIVAVERQMRSLVDDMTSLLENVVVSHQAEVKNAAEVQAYSQRVATEGDCVSELAREVLTLQSFHIELVQAAQQEEKK